MHVYVMAYCQCTHRSGILSPLVLNGHVTKITFDNGGLWQRLAAPPEACAKVI